MSHRFYFVFPGLKPLFGKVYNGAVAKFQKDAFLYHGRGHRKGGQLPSPSKGQQDMLRKDVERETFFDSGLLKFEPWSLHLS